MADQEQAALLRLLPPRSLPRRKKKPTFPPPPDREAWQHARGLGRGAALVRQHLKEAAQRFPQLATDVPYVRVQLALGALVSDADFKSLGLIPVYRRDGAVLAAYSPERDLRTLDSQLDSYARQRRKLAILAKIDTIKPWTRDDRTSERLRILGALSKAQEYMVDILLLPIDDQPANPQTLPVIERYVTLHRGRVVDRAAEPTFTALRVRLGGQALDNLLDYRDDIALVDLPPAAHVLIPQVLSLGVDELPEVPSPPLAAPAICVVDSGILEGHPLLENAVLSDRSRSFPEALGSAIPAVPVDEARHGTQVAGIALYGDVGAAAAAKSFAPPLWLINARLLDDHNELAPDRMPFVREVVQHVHDRCRIVNLSFGLEPSEAFLSVHAAELDALTREFGVLFVVAAGNVDVASYFGGRPPTKPYPAFLLDPGWQVLAPAEALNVLTVGGITPDRDPHNDQYHEAVAPKRAPSPFTRTGGLKNVVKPDLVEVAGNLAYDASINHWVENDPALRVPTMSHRFSEGQMLGFVHGTSFAAPRVAHLAARIIDRYPEATPNLLRALLVQSARFPEGVLDLEPKGVLQLCGFGVPDLDRALYCRPQRVTLYYEGEIEVDDVKLFEIPVPSEFARAGGRKALSVTLAYDPPVSVVHRDRPAGINLTWRLARGDVPERDVEAEIAAEAEHEVDISPPLGPTVTPERRKRVFIRGDLPSRLQQRGTVQKNIFTWRRGEHGDPYRLAITARATRPAHAHDRQRFAVVVTLECEDESVNVYTSVRTRLAAGRVRVRIPAE